MSKWEEARRPPLSSSTTTTAPSKPARSAAANAPQPPKAHPPPPPPGSGAHKGPPPNAVLIKVSKSLTSVPSATLGGPTAGSTSQPPAPVSVPAQCWYANPFNLSTNTPMTEFHRGMRGKVFFSPRAVPVTASELLSLPGERPPQLTVCEVGKDLLYGMGYLYNTPLSVEHQWRGRVAHLLRVRAHQAPLPNIVRRRAEAVAAAANFQRQQLQEKEKHGGATGLGKDAKPGDKAAKSTSPAPQASAAPVVIDYLRTMCYERGEATVYDRPGDDLLIGIKLYVNDELVEDHYPTVNALPQCTTTLAVKEATQHWNCVPFVLMGYLNQIMLDPICVYHSLSLNFVEHLLRIKLPDTAPPTKAPAAAAPEAGASSGKTKPAPAPKKKMSVVTDLPLRVEVVYGCRAEAYFCTDFISRGCCVLRMTESSKRALKNYEEKLRALVRLRRGAPQLIARDLSTMNKSSNNSGGNQLSHSSSGNNSFSGSGSPPPPRNCSGCGYPLQFRCTVCGADVCGMPMCAKNVVVGYPRACLHHALPPNSTELASLLKRM